MISLANTFPLNLAYNPIELLYYQFSIVIGLLIHLTPEPGLHPSIVQVLNFTLCLIDLRLQEAAYKTQQAYPIQGTWRLFQII